MFSTLVPLLLLILTTLIVPTLIVVLWKKRPVVAFITAAAVMLASVLFPPLAIAFGQMIKNGAADPQIISGNIAAAISLSIFCMVFFFPILAGIQWVARRNYVKSQTALNRSKEFE